MKQLLRVFLFLFFVGDASGQSAVPAIETDLLDQLSANNSDLDTDLSSSSYDSFSKNSFNNTVNQLKTLRPLTEEKFLASELRKKRIILAAELCDLDPRACILIENYQRLQNEAKPLSVKDLSLFGIDIFTGYPISLQAVDNESAADEYIIKVGDTFSILISGTIQSNDIASVNNSGAVVLD